MQSTDNIWSDENLIKVLNDGGVAVMPTDTIYGIVGSALNPAVVGRIYNIRKRAPEKPCIMLIGDINEINKFSINLSEKPEKQREIMKEYWSLDHHDNAAPVSIVLDCLDDSFSYLHRGSHALAFRLPMEENLRNLLKKTGPLIAPSANPEGLAPAQNIKEAQIYFGNAVDLYIDGGEIKGNPSKVIKLNKDGGVDVLRR